MRIAAADRARRERLLRYCARPAFALERLRELDTEHLLYDSAKPSSGATALRLTPLEWLERLAARGPPPWNLPEPARGQLDPQAQPAPAYQFDQRITW
ncbi:MAG: transposase [Burkholderiales bacterium]|nr:transposase [Burkholderiales bacterium]